jgi:uncharacterized membrane protein YqhA
VFLAGLRRAPSVMTDPLTNAHVRMRPLPQRIFMSRWLQLPLYASVLKVKLATAIIGISSIHLLLKTFINAQAYDEKTLLWQTTIHITFLLSAMAIAATDRIMPHGRGAKAGGAH